MSSAQVVEHREGAGAALHAHHAKLDAVFDELLEAYRGGDWDDVRVTWTRFEDELREHMLFEEKHILPLLADVSAGEAAALRAEHDTLRRMLGELGVGVDLHAVKDDVAAELVAMLRSHAAREDLLAYRLADRELPASAVDVLHATRGSSPRG